MPEARTLDERLAALIPEVDVALREELRGDLRTLRDSGNPIAVLLSMSRLGLRLLNELFQRNGHKRPSENLYDCIVTAARGDVGNKIKGLQILPDEMASYLHTLRTLSNKADHDAEKVRLTVSDAENALSLFLRVLEWFYCECERGPRLPTVYTVEAGPPVSLAEMLEAFFRSQQATEEEKRRLAAELERLRTQQETADQRRHALGRERVVGPVPSAVRHFKDRVPELRSLRTQLVDEHVRLVLVCGRGGMGKTALITKLLNDLQVDFTLAADATIYRVDSIVYVALRQPEFRAPDKIVELICRPLEPDAAAELRAKWQEKTSLSDKLEFLFRRTLSARRCLIVLDNFEDVLDDDNHIRDEFADLRQFVEKCLEWDHGARLVATSRRTLVLSPELEGRLSERKVELPLDGGLPEADAVTLLRELDTDGELGIRDMPEEAVRAVARRCYGIPRTLESLVGTLRQRRTLTLTRLLDDEAAFARLTDNPAQELYESLSPEERLVMQALAIYDYPVPAAAVRYLLPARVVEDILDALVRNYVVTYDRDRFSLHPLDQHHAYVAIPDIDGEYTKAALHAHAAEFFRQLRKPREAWKTIDDLESQLQEFHHLVSAGLYDNACSLLNEIDFGYLFLWGYFALVVELRSQLVNRLTDRKLQQVNWGLLGVAYGASGESRKAIEHGEQALAIARELGDRGEEGKQLGNLGVAYKALGEVRQAMEYHEQGLVIARQIGNRRGEGVALGNLGNAYSAVGELRQAIVYYEQALTIAREVGDRRNEGISLGNLGLRYRDSGEVQRGMEYHEQGLAIARQIGNRQGEATALANLGYAHYTLGEVQQGMEYQEQALAIAREVGDRQGEGIALGHQGAIYDALQEVPQAMEHYEQALVVAREIDNKENQAEVLLSLGTACHDQGNTADARRYYEEALALDISSTNYACAMKLAILCLEDGNLEAAQDYFGRGIALCRALLEKMPNLYDRLYTLALAHLASGQPDDALATYRQALQACSARGVVQSMLQDLRLLQRAAPAMQGLQAATDLLQAAIE